MDVQQASVAAQGLIRATSSPNLRCGYPVRQSDLALATRNQSRTALRDARSEAILALPYRSDST